MNIVNGIYSPLNVFTIERIFQHLYVQRSSNPQVISDQYACINKTGHCFPVFLLGRIQRNLPSIVAFEINIVFAYKF